MSLRSYRILWVLKQFPFFGPYFFANSLLMVLKFWKVKYFVLIIWYLLFKCTYIIRMFHLFGGLWGSNWIVSWSRLSRKFLSGKIYRISLISQKLHNTFCKHIPFMCIANTWRSRWISQAIPKIKTFLLNQTSYVLDADIHPVH